MIPDTVKEKFLNAEANKRKVWAGANQTFRMMLNGKAKIVLIADNVKPPEIVLPLINEAKHKKIETYYDSKEEIAKLAKCPRFAAAACLI